MYGLSVGQVSLRTEESVSFNVRDLRTVMLASRGNGAATQPHVRRNTPDPSVEVVDVIQWPTTCRIAEPWSFSFGGPVCKCLRLTCNVDGGFTPRHPR